MEDPTTSADGPTPRRRAASSKPPGDAGATPATSAPEKRKRASAANATARKSATASTDKPRTDQPGAASEPAKPKPRAKAASPKQAASGEVAPPKPRPRKPRKTATDAPQEDPAARFDIEPPVRVETERLEPAPSAPGESARLSRTPLWARLVADPGYASEHIAREAVHRLGPVARDWVARVRSRYPDATPDAIARLASAEAIQTTRRVGAGGGAAGILGTAAGTGPLARAQAHMVLAIAAAYGHDPADDVRARELLEILRAPRLTQPASATALAAGRLVAALGIARAAARAVPFGAAIAGSIQSGRSTEAVANRAIQRYRTAVRAITAPI